MAVHELLFEVGTEEIPAGFLALGLSSLGELMARALADARLEHEEITVLGTPRRLCVGVRRLADRQADVSEQVTGPPASVAFKDGKPTRAAEGFARKLGVDPSALEIVETDKGAYVAARREEKGAETRSLLPELLPRVLSQVPWPKSMRWAGYDHAFVRPVHWIVALFGGEVVPFRAYGVTSGRQSRGHRFLAPGPVDLDGKVEGYVKALRKSFVIVDPEARRTEIEAELVRVEKEAGVKVRPDPDLLAEVTHLVEYPKAVAGTFDEKFLEVPEEVIVTAMRTHQRYFATEKDGRLASTFVTIAGTLTADPEVVKGGNERVLAARLSDARFFFEQDRATRLESFAEKLGQVVFQARLGTMGDKVTRIRNLGIAELLGVEPALFDRGALLCKADLVSQMVGEFPELQGIMGRHYARLQGEDPEVCAAIEEHYLPRGATDRLPRSDLGAALGIGDRIDTIVGCFAVGLAPTGSADAFGLRRAALAILNVLLDRGWRVRLGQLVDAAAGQLHGKIKWSPELRGQILEFFSTRLKGLLVDGRGLPADCVDAALAAGFEDVPDAELRARAVAHLRQRPDFEPLGVAFKRVANILKGETAGGAVDEERFAHDSEKALWKSFLAVRDQVSGHVDRREYDAALTELATLKPVVDRFFDDVLVMDKDPAIKENRLALLWSINAAFLRIADFQRLQVG